MLLRRLAQTRRLYSSQASGTPRDLLFVFLEGGAATGKSSLCAELEQRGYKVQYEGFVSLCKQVRFVGCSPRGLAEARRVLASLH